MRAGCWPPALRGHPRALIVVRAEDEAGALSLLDDDPFQQAGFISERIPREWNPVIGVLASSYFPHRLMC